MTSRRFGLNGSSHMETTIPSSLTGSVFGAERQTARDRTNRKAHSRRWARRSVHTEPTTTHHQPKRKPSYLNPAEVHGLLIKPGSMLLCISDLPVGISIKDLKAFVLDGIDTLRTRSLRMSPAASKCTILRLTNPDNGAVSHQGLVAVQPARLALDLI